jgi:hypothetical protein
MKKVITLSLPKACSEQWSNFAPTTQGGWCNSCRKEVVDFTSFSEKQIIDYFSKTAGNTCGRFQASQLKAYPTESLPTVEPGWMFLKAGLLGLCLAFAPKPSSALPLRTMEPRQDFQGQSSVEVKQHSSIPFLKITGTVKSEEDGALLPGVNIVLKGTMIGTVTDENGQFKFDYDLKQGDVLVFSFIGLKTQEYVVPAVLNSSLEIVMKLDIDTMMMGEIVVGGVYVTRTTSLQKVWGKIKSIF